MNDTEYKDAIDYMAALRVLYLRGVDKVTGRPTQLEPVVRYVSWASGHSDIAIMNDLDARVESIEEEKVSDYLLMAALIQGKPQ